jgi:hypothetical protein
LNGSKEMNLSGVSNEMNIHSLQEDPGNMAEQSKAGAGLIQGGLFHLGE